MVKSRIFKIAVLILPAICCLLNVTGAKAETVSQKEAQQMASTFFNAVNGQIMTKPSLVYNGRKLTTDRLFSPFYIYNHPAGGFVIISAENKAIPILGYSIKENFNPEEMTAGLEALLRRYAIDIENIRHDSEIPEVAISAWNNFSGYVASILAQPYDATDPALTFSDTEEIVENFITTGREDELSSDIYTPAQWNEFAESTLSRNGEFALGIIDGYDVIPVIVHGHKGDFYRINFNDTNDWLMRLMATEIISYGQLADFGIAPDEIEETEELPFSLFEEMISGMQRDQAVKEVMMEELINPTSPKVRNVGGGRYEISLPAEAYMARIYNLSGSQVATRTYKGSNIASVSLEGLPYGFYIVLVNDINGTPYEFKFSR